MSIEARLLESTQDIQNEIIDIKNMFYDTFVRNLRTGKCKKI